MRILYIARHNQKNSADDEGAIKHALEVLGHSVLCVGEDSPPYVNSSTFDFAIFHKWDNVTALQHLQCPRVFWYFDLVDWPHDPTLRARCQQRMDWMARITPHVSLGFCTDGDWVSRDKSGKLVWLMQGADERVVGKERTVMVPDPPSILFTGISRGGGQRRMNFVLEMRSRWGNRFIQIERGLYGRRLAHHIAAVGIVVAPDSPVSGNYWSNRVYTTLGYGGFLLHPHSNGLRAHYTNYEHLTYYHDMAELHRHIDTYSKVPTTRLEISEAALQHTMNYHLYRHRVESLLTTLRARGIA